jgi:tetratricopeptide (TPR) repeat protein
MKKNKSINKTIHVIISITLILSLFYLIYYLNIEKANASIKNNKKITATPPDSAQIKLQVAINLAKTSPNENKFINLSLVYYNNGNYQECIDASKKALAINANCYQAYNNLCYAYSKIGWWDEAIVAGKKAIEIRPGDILATNNLKAATTGKAKQDKFLSDTEGLLTIHPSESNYIRLGNTYYGVRKYEKAISAFQKAIKFNSKSSIAYNNICSAYNKLGKWKEASIYCEQALNIYSTFELAKNNLKIAKSNLAK